MASVVPNINLLQKTKRIFDKHARKRKRITSVSTIALVIYLAILLPIVGYRIFLSTTLNSIRRDIDQKTQGIQQQQAKEQRQILLSNKLTNISEALDNRILFHELLIEMFELFPENASLQSVDLNKADNKITVSGIVSSVFTMSELFQSFTQSLESNLYAQITITSLTKSSEGEYSVSAEITSNSN